MKEPTWTPEMARALDAVLSQPIMQDFLAELKERTRVKGNAGSLPPGYDALVLSAASFNHASGQSSVLDMIEELRTERKPVKDLPPPFQAPKGYKPE